MALSAHWDFLHTVLPSTWRPPRTSRGNIAPDLRHTVACQGERWHAQERDITEITREMGMSWFTVSTGATLCLFHRGMVIGFGSRKEEYVDSKGSPKALFEKARFVLSYLPPEFLDGFNVDKHALHMRILFPGTGPAMTGESGDGIGRGDRTSVSFHDEAAVFERPQLIDASQSQTVELRPVRR